MVLILTIIVLVLQSSSSMLENRIRSYWLKCLEAGETTQCIQIYGICSLFHGVLNRLWHFIGNLILYSHSIYCLIDVIVTDPSNGSLFSSHSASSWSSLDPRDGEGTVWGHLDPHHLGPGMDRFSSWWFPVWGPRGLEGTWDLDGEKMWRTCFRQKAPSGQRKRPTGWWFGTWILSFPYIGNNSPNWLIFCRGVGIPPTSKNSCWWSCLFDKPWVFSWFLSWESQRFLHVLPQQGWSVPISIVCGIDQPQWWDSHFHHLLAMIGGFL